MATTDPGSRPAEPPHTRLDRVAAVAGAPTPAADHADVLVTGVTLRAQSVRAGDLFAALPGTRVHGARFAAEAAAAGAAAVLTDPAGAALLAETGVAAPVIVAEDPRAVLGAVSDLIYGHPSRHLNLIGVTGTAGKTTVTHLIEAGLKAAGRRAAVIGTVGVRIDGVDLPSALTTPEAPELQGLLAVMVERGIDTVVMEVSSHALVLGRVDGCRFAVGAFTNLSQDHLDFHRDLEDYFAAKMRLLAPDSAVRARAAVVCVDDEWGRRAADLAAGDPALPTVTVGVESGDGAADWSVRDVQAAADGTQRFLARREDDEVPVELALPGRFNIANALVALAVLDTVGIAPAVAGRALIDAAVPGRLERIDAGQDFLAVVDYAHKPGALSAVLTTLRRQTEGRLIVVIGAGGDRDAGKREVMGRVSAELADLVVVTDDNPRTEDPDTIRAALVAGTRQVPEGGRAEVAEYGDRAAAIAYAIGRAQTGDAVLVAGKGHETGQQIGARVEPFDDRTVVAEAIAARDRAATTRDED